MSADLPPVSELVPHRGIILLLDRILEHDGKSTAAQVSVERQNWLKRSGGSVGSWLAVEYMAQCIAAHEGLLARAEGRPLPRGFLVAVSGLRLYQPEFEAGDVLRVSARKLRGRHGLGVLSHTCTIHKDFDAEDARLLAEGRLSISVGMDSLADRGSR